MTRSRLPFGTSVIARCAVTAARITAAAALAAMGICSSACGHGGGAARSPTAEAAPLPPANPQAVTKMVQGVQAVKEPNGRERGIALLREAVSLDKGLWEAHYDLGIVFANGSNLGDAEDELAAAAKIAPEAEDVAVALGEVRRRRGEQRAAADGLGEFLERRPNALGVRTLYVATLRDSGQLDRAIKEAREVLVRKPADASALAELALCHVAKGEKDIAQLLARQALDANPKSAVAHRAMGVIALANGDDAMAFQSFLKATQEDPRDTTARLNMGAVLLRAGAYAKAEEQYRAILQVSPEDADAAVGLAASLRGQADASHGGGKLEEAKALLEKTLEREPHHVSALFNLGILYAEGLKKKEEAKTYFKRFLADAPEGNPARPEAERYLEASSGGDPKSDAPAASSAPAAASPAVSAPPAPPPKGKGPKPKGTKK